ncbi:SRPBCC domain-containing protein [Aestuariimicrobium soli]|uniref:SRPBCC domain-containing protein n=1 Tax=Aestuariimicrobium soli TaxID=2035834 RepID=UPI003EBAAECE
MDVQEQIGAVTRAWRREERDGETVHVQTLSQLYPSPLDDVWDAVTTSERIPRWFLPITGDLEVGGRYQFEGNAGGEVLECEPPADGRARYLVTWEMGGVTWVTVRLLAEGDSSTRFELEHVAKEADVPAEMSAMFGPGATGVGWDGGLLGLWLHLTRSGGSMSPADLAAWVATDEGKAFYRGAADAWAQASIEAGTPEEQARQQADATYGFYTGA